jgi:hypothetical protein
MEILSIDEQILPDRKSIYFVRVKGKKKRLGLAPGDILVVDKALPLKADALAVMVRSNKFCIDLVTEDFLRSHDPDHGDFIWGMVRAMVRELP